MKDDSKFGTWRIDANGLPAFAYTCKEFEDTAARYFSTWGDANTHYHLLGNACWLGIATNHGQVYCLDPRRGFTLVGGEPGSTVPNRSSLVTFKIQDQGGRSWHDVNTPGNQPLARRTFGAGYIEKGIDAGRLRIASRILFPPGDDPVIVAECSIENLTNESQRVRFDATWNLFHLPLSKSLIVSWNKRKKYQTSGALDGLLRFAVALQRIVKMDTDGARREHSTRIKFTFEQGPGPRLIAYPRHAGEGKHDPTAPSDINHHLKPVAIACIDDHATTTIINVPPGTTRNAAARIIFACDIDIPPGATINKRFLLAIERGEELGPLIGKYRAASRENDLQARAAAWFKDRLATLEMPDMPWLGREIAWHGTSLLSSMFRDEYHGFHRIPQGSVYLLGHGFDGSIRDFCLFCYPLVFMDPALAREFLKFIYTCVDEQGRIAYALHGFGKKLVVPGIHANPSDQYFFVTWVTAEYIYLTRDFGFLDEPVTIKDEKGRSKQLTVKELLARVIKYVMSPEIGLGEHDMIRVRDGDWNDGISLMAKNRKAFIKYGESTFNSAMLLLSFEKIAPLIDRFDPALARDMEKIRARVERALDKAWNGKWYFRGYDGQGHPLGDDTLYLDHHAWMLQNRSLPDDKIRVLLDSITNELVFRSSCGAAIMHPPNSKSPILPPGWDINGGTWHALNSLLAWGMRIRKPEQSFEFLQRASMHNRAERYPRCWYGIWSGPDAYNADDAERPGEAFYHASTPMCDFPFMNNNLHAGFLAAAIRCVGIEACFDRLRIDVPASKSLAFTSRILDITSDAGRIEVKPGTAFKQQVNIEIVLPGGFGAAPRVAVEPASHARPLLEGGSVRVTWIPNDPPRRITIVKG